MKELRHLSTATLLVFAVIALSAFYWSVLGAEGLVRREDNPRLVEAEIVTQRGAIYDRQGVLLATTTVNYDGEGLRRLYPHPETAPAVGYYSLRFGVSGVEASYDRLLSGQEGLTILETWTREALHQPAVGGDVRLTLDLSVQRTAARALGSRRGALVLATIPDGAIRAMVSAPIFDPNVLDENWDALVADPDAPLVNRVTQGLYQPGGLLETVLLATAISNRIPMDTFLAGSAGPVAINGLALTCAQPPPGNDLTLLEAYTYACPGAFAQLTVMLPADLLDGVFGRFGLFSAPPLLGMNTEASDAPPSLAAMSDGNDLAAETLGQGALTITPLQALDIAAAVANQGNAPRYRLVEAARLPGEESWIAVEDVGMSRAVLTREAAEQVQQAMRAAANEGVAAAAQTDPDHPVLGHVATAFSGPEATPLQWFIGLVRFSDNTAIAVVVVLEDSDSPQDAAQVGGQALAAATRAFAPPFVTQPATAQPAP